MSGPRFIDIVRFVVKLSLACFLASLLLPSAYGQDLALDGNAKTRVARFFGPGLTLTRPAGITSLTTLDSPLQHPSRVPVTTVAWSTASMVPTTPVVPPAAPSLSTHRERTTTMRVVAGLLGTGLAGLGAYLVSTSEGSSRVEICTLCSEPPASTLTHVHLTGRQGAGIASIAVGGGLLVYAAIP